MAIGIAEYVFTAAGQRIYPVAAKINGVNYVRVTLDDVPFTDSTQFDIINNSIVFTDEAAPSTGVEVKIYIATSEEFLSNFDVGVANPTNLDVVGEDLALGEESVITIVGNNIAYVRDAANNALDISTVANNIDDINIVASNNNNITTVANNTTNINTVANNNNNITAVANNNTNITAVANNATNITAVANNATNINAVNSNKTNIDTVAANNSNITTVAGISTKVTTVANNIDDVGNVSDNMSDINDVQDSLDDITTVSGAVGNVNTVATNIAKVSTVSTNIANVNTVANNITNVNTVANNTTNINTVATNNTNVNTVATNINDINSIVDDIANIDIVANNIEDINTFSDTYFISATTPTSPTEGDLWFDTVNNIMKVYDGSNFVAAYATLSGALIANNNLSDLNDVAEARTNLGLDDTDSVNFGSVTANTFTLEDAPIGAGIFSWNSDEVTADLTQNGSTLQLGQEFQYSVINQSGVDIPNATVVAAVGTIGASGKIKIAKWNASTMGTKYILGITTEAINNGNTGKVTKDGKVRDVDTGSIAGTYTDGVIYASTSTAGGLTYDKPTDKAIALAFLISAETSPSANNGIIMVRNTVFDENEYQAKLVSGTNIKTVNSTSLLGSGDIAVPQLSGVTAYHLLEGSLALASTTPTSGFSTTLYTGNGSTQSINTGIDMATQWGNDASETFGGLVWLKCRNTAIDHYLFDSVRGVQKAVWTSLTDAQYTYTDALSSFNSNGFTLGANTGINYNTRTMASWNFQTTHRTSGTTNHGKAYTCHYNPYTGFTMVRYEGSGIAGHEIPHHLGRKLGFAHIKNLSSALNWVSQYKENSLIKLNTTESEVTATTVISNFGDVTTTLSTASDINASSNQYILYGWSNSYFDESNKLIGNYEIGVYQGTGASGNKITTRGKPAWVMVKILNSTGSWIMVDNQRTTTQDFRANTSNQEFGNSFILQFQADGFTTNTYSEINASGGIYLYMVVYDNDSGSGKSKYPKPADAPVINLTAKVPLACGVDLNGTKNTVVSKNETIYGVTLSEGKNYIAWVGE